jgi:hypothetical protein
MTDDDFVAGLRAAVPEAFADSAPDAFEDEDGALVYTALGHALLWLVDHAIKRRWWRPVGVRPEAEDALRRFWAFIERALEDAGPETRNLVWIECFEHDDWDVAERFMGARTRTLRFSGGGPR